HPAHEDRDGRPWHGCCRVVSSPRARSLPERSYSHAVVWRINGSEKSATFRDRVRSKRRDGGTRKPLRARATAVAARPNPQAQHVALPQRAVLTLTRSASRPTAP